jgi:7-cyano-7-deazaguanine reductase
MTDGESQTVMLESFESPTGQIITFTTDELTALCPFKFGGPDFYHLTLRYESAGLTVESKSLKQYVETWRDSEISAEKLAQSIYNDVKKTAEPCRLYVRLEQARRGGIEETVEVGNVDLR